MKLDKTDIEKIALYVPFRVEFSPAENYTLWTRYFAQGIIGSTVIGRWDEEEGNLEDYSDISHPQNTDLPILRRLEGMSDEEFSHFFTLTRFHPSRDPVSEMASWILTHATPDITLFALQKHFDIFGLIDQGKALDRAALKKKKENQNP